MAPRKLKLLSLADKVKLIREVEKGEKTRAVIASDFGIPRSTLSTILKNKVSILTTVEHGKSGSTYRNKKPQHDDVENCVLRWFQETRKNNIPVSGPILQQKAKDFADVLKHDEFRASNGWLYNFKKRYGISGRVISGESASVREDVCAEWIGNLPDLLQNYTPDEVYNADETGLFYRCLPNKTLDFKNTKVYGGKDSKERLTVLFTTNMTGTVKRAPLVIGKSAKPRCFKNVKSLPTDYTSNKKAWMTGDIFKQWLLKWDMELCRCNSKALLFIDNCTAHNAIPVMSSLKVQFLPPNTTSKLQPMDLGIIKNFKVKYRKEVVQHLLRDLAENRGLVPINVLEAVRYVKKAWDEVTSQTIRNCFAACGFDTETNEASNEDSDGVSDTDWELISASLVADIHFMEFVEVDCELPVCETPTDEHIVAEVQQTQSSSTEVQSDDDEEVINDIETQPPTAGKARRALETVRMYLESCEDVDPEMFTKLNTVSRIIRTNEKKLIQTNIKDYLKVKQ